MGIANHNRNCGPQRGQRRWTFQRVLFVVVVLGGVCCHGFSSSPLLPTTLRRSSPSRHLATISSNSGEDPKTTAPSIANANANNSNNNNNTTTGASTTISTATPQPEGIGGKGGVVYDVNRLKRNLLQETMAAYKEELWESLNHHPQPHQQQQQQQQVLVEKLAALVQASPVRTTTDSNLLEGNNNQHHSWVLAYRSQYPATVASLVLYEGDMHTSNKHNKNNNNKRRTNHDNAIQTTNHQAYNARYNFLWQPKQTQKEQQQPATKTQRTRRSVLAQWLTTHQQRSYHLEDIEGDQDAHVIDRCHMLGGLVQRTRQYRVQALTRSSLTLQLTSDKWSVGRRHTQTHTNDLVVRSPEQVHNHHNNQDEEDDPILQVQVIYLDNDLCITAEEDGPQSPFWVYTRNQAYLEGTTQRQWRYFKNTCRRVVAFPVTAVRNQWRRRRPRLRRTNNDPILSEIMALDNHARLRVLRLGDVSGGDDDDSWESEADPFVHLSADERQRLLKSMSVKTVAEAANIYRATQFQKKWLRPWRLLAPKKRNQTQRGFRKPPTSSSPRK